MTLFVRMKTSLSTFRISQVIHAILLIYTLFRNEERVFKSFKAFRLVYRYLKTYPLYELVKMIVDLVFLKNLDSYWLISNKLGFISKIILIKLG